MDDWIKWFKKTINLKLNATQIYYYYLFQTQSINLWKPNHESFLIPMAKPNVAQPQNLVHAQIQMLWCKFSFFSNEYSLTYYFTTHRLFIEAFHQTHNLHYKPTNENTYRK